MDKLLLEFIELEKIFKKNNFSLYLVGGTVRDYLLNKPLEDMDAVTDATPEDMKLFLENADYTFSRMGSVKYKFNGIKFDITTLREENNYKDSRHPTSVKFVKDLKIDVKRRDFTINGMYLDSSLNTIDLVNGGSDLSDGVIRMIGDPLTRLEEDPLRIIRAIRFALDLNFRLDDELEKVILENIHLLKNIRLEKIKQDLAKIKNADEERKMKIFDKFGITNLLNVIE